MISDFFYIILKLSVLVLIFQVYVFLQIFDAIVTVYEFLRLYIGQVLTPFTHIHMFFRNLLQLTQKRNTIDYYCTARITQVQFAFTSGETRHIKHY